ncbi:maleylpyruvate isomerase family mycothiol-dependent enzyme [Streptomyces sp. NBC_01304]|uniref:maleylpyruvate isomerase family mycothiol-dependent enzyme n=1 Tax=Streptomyces sp. NBC_01304 TaxID=2903818 RepID=UPI002E10067C|nr:maleylpyruvate isomerase family mycothiol-dependent enzyme [Streptomyces sp. NBC_01304]
MDKPDIEAILDHIEASHARLAATTAKLDDAQLDAPSRLPGWTRRDTLDHIAGAADAYVRLLNLARIGTPHPAAPGDGDGDVQQGLERMLDDARRMPYEAWDVLVTAKAGYRHPAWFTLYRCWRELETHHVDLGSGYESADWPQAYVSWALDGTLVALAARGFPLGRVEATDLGRTWTLSPAGPAIEAPGHALLGWLSGRSPAPGNGSGAGVPQPPDWPLPPTPAWG